MFTVEVDTAESADSTGKWSGNGLRFATKAEAEAYARDLEWRWTSVRRWRVVKVGDAGYGK